MNTITQLEHKVLCALDNEALTCTKEQRDAFQHQVSAYRNAASYADQWGYDVDEFRAAITKLTGVTKADLVAPDASDYDLGGPDRDRQFGRKS